MKRGGRITRVFLTTLVMAGLLACLAGPAFSAEGNGAGGLDDEFALLAEQDFVLAASKHKQKIGYSPSAVIVITRKEIEESGATTLSDLFRRYPALHVYVIDPIYPSIMIRGTIRVLLIIDGRETNLEFFVAPFYELLPVGLDDIERIEIVLGPNSALYGANAVSAVIDITTRKPKKDFEADLSLKAGQHGSTILGGRLGGIWGPVSLQGALRMDDALSWQDRGIKAKRLLRNFNTLRIDLGPGDRALTLDAGMVSGTGRIYSIMGYMDMDKLIIAHGSALFEWDSLFADSDSFKAGARWYNLRTDFVLDLDLVLLQSGEETLLGKADPFSLTGDTFHADMQYDLGLFDDALLLIMGTDFRYTNYRSEQLVDDEIVEYRAGFFVHGELMLFDCLQLTAGGRFDYNSVTDPAFSPRGAIVYNPGGDHYIRLSAGSAFRKPTMLETSANFEVSAESGFPEIEELFETRGISNADLRNESLTGVGLGYRGAVLERRLRFGLDAYLSLNRNLISFRTDIAFRPPPFNMQIDLEKSRVGYANSGDDFDIVGVNFFFEADPADWLTLFFRGEYRYEWFTADNRKAPKVPKLSAAVGGTLRLHGITAHLALSYVSARQDVMRDPRSILEPSNWVDLPAVTMLLASVYYTMRPGDSRVDVGISFFNPFGSEHREKGGTLTEDGTNFGGEIIGSRVMLTARVRY